MIAMRYAFEFDDDFDMTAIRDRIADRGPAFDDWPGLAAKAFLIHERLDDRRFANRYGTYYLWEDAAAARAFLAGDAFAAVAAAFGRPRVDLLLPLVVDRFAPDLAGATRALARTLALGDEDPDRAARRIADGWAEDCAAQVVALDAAAGVLDHQVFLATIPDVDDVDSRRLDRIAYLTRGRLPRAA